MFGGKINMLNNPPPQTQERYSSHIPALATLIRLGWQFIPQKDCFKMRHSQRDVLLRSVLRDHLAKQQYEYKGQWILLSEHGIDQIMRELTVTGLTRGLMAENQRLYDQLTLGITVTEFIDGKKHQPTINIIDWEDVTNNQFHVTEEFNVLSAHGTHTRQPDIVCFVNGLPLVVIEAKRPDADNPGQSMVDEGISQMLRNQNVDEIPALFAYSQLLIAVSSVEGRYGTTYTGKKHWSCWREEILDTTFFQETKNTTLDDPIKTNLFQDKPQAERLYFENKWSALVEPTEQDKLLISLLRHDRLLEFVRYFILFDKKKVKIAARYQQVFGIKRLLERINQFNGKGARQGGVVWHTTGSGKSFTMVYLCKALLLADTLKDCRIIVVTDRRDLEQQLSHTFLSGGALGESTSGKKRADIEAKAQSGKQLAKRIGQGNERILFTLIDKFKTAAKLPECYNASANIIVLVDEGHRSHGGENHERMRQALPNAAYIAFTGTPLLKKDKTRNKFGPIIHAYTMKKAVQDGAVAPLLYEERQPKLDVNERSIDSWFNKITAGLSQQQKNDVKKKIANKGIVYDANRRIKLIAWDISSHFKNHFKALDLGLKGQIACENKQSAIRYKQALDEIGMVSSRVIMSSPDTREGHEEVDNAEALPEVQQWWRNNINDNEEVYEKQVLDNFATEGDPDLLIVVDKLLTGFDEPRNAVLYIDKSLKEHNLIQAIARVNRLHDNKQYGLLIDYRGILQELDTAMQAYQDLEQRTQGGFEIEDIEGLYQNIDTQYKRLPRLHRELWELFKNVENKHDIEQYRQLLMPRYEQDAQGCEFDSRQKAREDFYEVLRKFSSCLNSALSSHGFFEDKTITEAEIEDYKRDRKWFVHLRKIIKSDAQQTVDYSQYEKPLKGIIDKDLTAYEIAEPESTYYVHDRTENKPEHWSEEKTRNETDIIRSRVKKTIQQKLSDDPYAQKYFSELLKERIKEAESLFDYPQKQYLLFKQLEDEVEDKQLPDVPSALKNNMKAQAYYGIFKLVLDEDEMAVIENNQNHCLTDEAIAINEAVTQAKSEYSLNPQDMEAAIKRELLPRLYNMVGLQKASTIIDYVIQSAHNREHNS